MDQIPQDSAKKYKVEHRNESHSVVSNSLRPQGLNCNPYSNDTSFSTHILFSVSASSPGAPTAFSGYVYSVPPICELPQSCLVIHDLDVLE